MELVVQWHVYLAEECYVESEKICIKLQISSQEISTFRSEVTSSVPGPALLPTGAQRRVRPDSAPDPALLPLGGAARGQDPDAPVAVAVPWALGPWALGPWAQWALGPMGPGPIGLGPWA